MNKICKYHFFSLNHIMGTPVLTHYSFSFFPPLLFSLTVKNPPLEPSSFLSLPPKQPNKIGFDEVYMHTLIHSLTHINTCTVI